MSYVARNHPQQLAVRGAVSFVDDRETDPDVFAALNERFHFTIDAAATTQNAKLENFWTEADDALTQNWGGHRVWCNPPYSDIEPWVIQAWDQWEWAGSPAPGLIVMLLPANRTEQRWWQKWVEPWRDTPGERLTVEFLPGRMRFIAPGDEGVRPNARPPFGCCLLIWSVPALIPLDSSGTQ